MLNQIKTALISVSMAFASFQAQAETFSNQSGNWHYSWGWGHMIFGSLMMILFWGGIILAIVFVIRSTQSGGGDRQPTGKSPLDILNERFARGEIDKEEFEEKKKLLSR